MEPVSPLSLLLELGGVDKGLVGSVGEDGVWKLLKELLEKSGGYVDIMIEVGRVAEVDCWKRYVSCWRLKFCS